MKGNGLDSISSQRMNPHQQQHQQVKVFQYNISTTTRQMGTKCLTCIQNPGTFSFAVQRLKVVVLYEIFQECPEILMSFGSLALSTKYLH